MSVEIGQATCRFPRRRRQLSPPILRVSMVGSFVWEVHLRQDVLDDAVAELKALPYAVLCQILERPLKKRVRGRDTKLYRLTVTAALVKSTARDLEITVSLKHRWFGKPLSNRFVVTAPPAD